MIPGEIETVEGDIELNAGPRANALTVANTGDRPIQVGSHYHFAETNPALRSTAPPRAASAWTSPPAPRCASSRGRPARSCWCPTKAAASCTVFAATSWAGSTDGPHHPPRLCRHVRPHRRRPRAPGRHRIDRRGRARPDHLRRGSEVRRRQGDPRRHGPVAALAGGGRGRHRHHQRADHRPLGHRQGRCRHHQRPHRRASARRATRTCSPASTSSSARAPRSSPARARSSPPAASTATSISSARSRSRRRSPPASPRWSAAAPGRRPARRPPPARQGRGTSRACCRRPRACR